MRNLVIVLCVSLLISGCDRLNGLDEGDRNTFTWKGTIYDGYSDNPLRNRPVYLEASYAGVPAGKVEIIGETTTDENGYYSITYRKLKGLVEGVALYVENGQYSNLPALSAPPNESIIRDVSTINHSRVFIEIRSNQIVDSIYFGLPVLIKDQSEIFGMKMPTSSKLFKVAQYYPQNLESSYLLKSEIGSNHKNDPIELTLAFGLEKQAFKTAFTAHHFDSIPDDFNRIKFEARGFPYTDTVEINLE